MPYITYVARDSLVAGHNAGDPQTIEHDLQARVPQKRVERFVARGYSGLREESVLFRRETLIEVITQWFPTAQEDDWTEFMDSTDNGDIFTIDLYGTVAVPVSPISAVRTENNWQFQYDGPGYRALNFTIRQR